MFTITCHLPFLIASHTLLNHESVHVNVWLKTTTVSRIGQTVIFEVLFDLEGFFLFNKHFMEALDGASFQIELLLDGIDT